MSGREDSPARAQQPIRPNSGNAAAPPPTSPMTAFGVILGVLGVAAFLIVVLVVVPHSGYVNRAGFVAPGDNCSVITCPAGPSGPL